MTTIEVARHGMAALLEDDDAAAFDAIEWRRAQRPASGVVTDASDVRMMVEILRRFGGHAAAALLGGRFRPSAGGETMIEVGVGVGYDAADRSTTCSSELYRRFIVGLPDEFADGVMDGLLTGELLPAGVLTIDRAGFSEIDSSAIAFRLTADLLVTALAARLAGESVEDAARNVVSSW